MHQGLSIMVETAKYIRNLSLIAHIDHGKTTLSDYIMGHAGLIPQNLMGTMRVLDNLEEEQKRGITIETSLASLNVKTGSNHEFLLNLIDTPGHIDFSGKVAEALRLVDGCVIIIDVAEGIMAQTTTVIRQAMKERIQPLVFVNKIDRLIKEFKLSADEIQSKIEQLISNVRNLLKKSDFQAVKMPSFANGLVILGSAKDGWAITYQTLQKKKRAMLQVLESYENLQESELSEIFPLNGVIVDSIFAYLPSPVIAQKIRFPELLKMDINETVVTSKSNSRPSTEEQILNEIQDCNPTRNNIILTGKLMTIGMESLYGSLIRVLSGKIRKHQTLYSSLTGKRVKISRIVRMDGRKIMEIKNLEAGNIGVAIFKPSMVPGDIVSYTNTTIHARDIEYVQDPVVSISIEPKQIKNIEKLQTKLNDLAKITPGLEVELDPDTGELTVLGVGTLQLELFVQAIQKYGIAVETSLPEPIKFEMPTYENTFELRKWEGYNITTGNSNKIHSKKEYIKIYEDKTKNLLFVNKKNFFSAAALDGICESFRQAMRISPLSGSKIKNFAIYIEQISNKIPIKTYEYGIIFCSAVVRESLANSGVKLHEAVYTVEISVDEYYLGKIIHELQKLKAEIINATTQHQISTILANVSINSLTQSADVFRSQSDGNAFWSYKSVKFIPIH